MAAQTTRSLGKDSAAVTVGMIHVKRAPRGKFYLAE
jgi:hypothetical protein